MAPHSEVCAARGAKSWLDARGHQQKPVALLKTMSSWQDQRKLWRIACPLEVLYRQTASHLEKRESAVAISRRGGTPYMGIPSDGYTPTLYGDRAEGITVTPVLCLAPGEGH
ncbi:hypothetical protein EYF80_059967 [Liparis tanakae]|uniref:Uncharacterized protein n=1 Tax=Liparis tanakae TaxID=230148 RepID=A0A4Z2EN26_9TELE|nr:hypothetical protein EYF80_059967 [Liparis tanakae]